MKKPGCIGRMFLVVISWVLGVAGQGAGATAPGYFRQPAIHGQTVVFVAEGDLWRVSTEGGTAQRLTSHPGLESHPVFSRDGGTIAFSASYEGPTEIYTMPVAGGLPVRRSYDGAGSDRSQFPACFAQDGDLLYVTAAHSTLPNPQLVRLDLATGAVERIPLAQAADGELGPDDQTVFFVRIPFNGSHAKRYKGGTIEQIWKFGPGMEEARPLTSDYEGTSREPMVWNDRVYFVSDRDGTMNVWSMSPEGTDLRQHSRHAGLDVLGASMHDGRVVYQLGADLRLLDVRTDEDRAISITLATDFDQTREQWVEKPLDYLSDYRLGPDGGHVVLTARGEVFVAPAKQKRFVEASRAADVRYRQARLMPDGKQILAMSDESGEVELWLLPANGVGERRQLTTGSDVLLWRAEASPDGKHVAFTDKNLRVWLLDVGSGERKQIDEGNYDYIEEIAWSADSRYIAYTMPVKGNEHRIVRLYDVQAGSRFDATTDRYNSFSPAFSQDGKWLYLLSERKLETVVRSPWGPRQPEPFFDRPVGIYALALQPGLKSPFEAATELDPPNEEKSEDKEDGTGSKDAPDAGAGEATKNQEAPAQPAPGESPESSPPDQPEKKDEEKKPKLPAIVAEGLAERLYEVPAPAGNYAALAVTDKHLFFLSTPDRHEDKAHLVALEITNESPKPVTVVADVGGYELSLDRKKILVRKGDAFHIIKAEGSEAKLDEKTAVDLSGWKIAYTPREQWRQMFIESWRLMRDYFYDTGMHGVDWPAMREKYYPLVERVADRHELADLIAQMVSELGALHTFVRGGDLRRGEDNVQPGALGAVLSLTDDRSAWRIDHIFRSDPDEPWRRSPLARLDLGVSEGDFITMINGTGPEGDAHPARLLRNQAGKQVLIRIRPADGSPERDAIVVPISQDAEADLRYHEWEYTRRLRVEELSGGRIGYIHLRAMGAGDMASWARQYYAVYDKEGLIVDVRHNRGGNIDSWLLNRLLRRAWFYWKPRVGMPYWNMQQAFRGHKCALINERTASDGEAFAEGFRRLGLGKLIGVRTWGGGIWLTSSNTLVDGGIATAAEFGVFAPEGQWIIEGTGIEPDIEVDNLPHATFLGEDAQLDFAVRHLLELMEKEPVAPPSVPPGKDLSWPPAPAR